MIGGVRGRIVIVQTLFVVAQVPFGVSAVLGFFIAFAFIDDAEKQSFRCKRGEGGNRLRLSVKHTDEPI